MPKKEWFIIGLMSGTSLDGLDLAYVHFLKKNGKYSYKIGCTETVPYTDELLTELKNAFETSPSNLGEFDSYYGEYLGEQVNRFIKVHGIEQVDFIASHGHTIFHKPDEGFTLQIGSGNAIFKTTGIPVVNDFRTQDVKLGGQGAPLVPIGDRLLFSEYDYCLNLGGFANISFEKNMERIAFDICPVNIVLNHYAKQTGVDYDDKGVLSKRGKVNMPLLESLNGLSYYQAALPKTLGYEFVVNSVFPLIVSADLPINDVLRTFIEHVAVQIAANLTKDHSAKVLISGGGAYNDFLLERIRAKTSVNCIVPSAELIDYKEAMIFAFLGLLKLENEVNCLRSVTGATVDHSSGDIVGQIE